MMIGRLRAIVRSRGAAERGTSLVELMVVVALLGIMLPAIYGTMSLIEHQASVTTDRFAATENGQIVMDRLSRELRAAAAPNTIPGLFVSATALDVTFYSSLGAALGPTRIHACTADAGATMCATSGTTCYSLGPPASAGMAWPGCSLLEVITKATGTAAAPLYTGPSTTQIDATNVSSAGTIFSYFTTGSTTPLTPTVLATTTGLATIGEVWITIATQVGPLSPPVSIGMQVPLPNFDYSQAP